MARHLKLDAKERSARAEAVLDIIEAAIEFDGDLDELVELPKELRDPVKVMERIRALLDGEVSLPVDRPSASADPVENLEEYRAAARNGSPIPEPVLVLMHQDRAAVEGAAEDM